MYYAIFSSALPQHVSPMDRLVMLPIGARRKSPSLTQLPHRTR